MSNNAPIGVSSNVPVDVNGRGLWPLWFKNQVWRQKVEEQTVRKALDIPDNDMNIKTTTNSGIGAAGAVGIAAAAGLPGLALAAASIFGGSSTPTPTPPATPPVQPPAAVSPADSSYDVLFYDKDGNQIVVPHVSQRKAD